ncbi:MAG: GTP-binding protein [Desulfobacterales bacterium]|nr:GTP-binding protein [Desulfobacterales bacterium]
MIQKKICMLGSFAVGKTSLVRHYVKGMFSEKYLTTVGVKIDKKQVTVENRQVNLILWDLAGEDDFQRVQRSYLRGTSGYLLVADGTRRETIDMALTLQNRAEQELGAVPFLLLINKADLTDEWDMDDIQLDQLKENGWRMMLTSAKTGENVEAAFTELTAAMLNG